MVDTEAGMVGMEWVDGWSVREVLGGGAEGEEADPEEEEEGHVDEVKAARRKEAEAVLENLGVSVGEWFVCLADLQSISARSLIEILTLKPQRIS